MRRYLSIATVLALLSSMATPVLAACTGSGRAATCHAMAPPHADRPMHHHHHGDDVADQSPRAGFFAGENNGKCPMDCCTPGHRQNGASPVTASTLSPLALSDHSIHLVAVIFLSAGFSSHTDRGPPSA